MKLFDDDEEEGQLIRFSGCSCGRLGWHWMLFSDCRRRVFCLIPLFPAEFGQGVDQSHGQLRRGLLCFGLFAAENGVAAQFLLQLAPLVSVDPAKDTGVFGVRAAKGDPIGPVLRQSVFARSWP